MWSNHSPWSRRLPPLALALSALFAAARSDGASPVVKPLTAARPALVVELVLDGVRQGDLERWRSSYGAGGLARLLDGGVVYQAAHYPYATTHTCAGHATLSTGTLPERHGIIANGWLDRATRAKVSCVEDRNSPLVDGGKGNASAERLLTRTLADELVATRGAASRVLALALKDRAAVMLAGRLGTALWWSRAGGFTTSRAYAETLPAWVARWNRERPSLVGSRWERAADAEVYRALGPDDDARERPPAGLGRVFPHPLASEDAVMTSPAGIDRLLDFALAAVRAERLGTRPPSDGRPTRDLLAISISSTDLVSHHFGPDSHEELDTLLRLDRALATFFTALDHEVGLDHVLVALSADHGMTPTPPGAGSAVTAAQVTRAAQAALDAAYGADKWILGFTVPFLYLDGDTLERRHVALANALGTCKRAVAALPGVAGAWSAAELTAAGARGPLAAARASYRAERAGDLFVLPARGVLLAPDDDVATSHGTPYDYDTHVPLLVYGGGLRAAHVARPVSPADLAPTLAAWLEVPLPQATGTPLREALPRR